MTSRTLVIVIILAAAAIGTWSLSRSKSDPAGDSLAPELIQRGYYLKQARILGTGEDGKLLYEIEAERAEQMHDDQIDFTDVRIRYAPASDVPWIVSADTATLREGSAGIVLRGHVTAQNLSESAAEETEIRTDYLEFDPERYVAETDGKVQIRFGSRSLTATGMLASLNEQKIRLKSNVRGKIAP